MQPDQHEVIKRRFSAANGVFDQHSGVFQEVSQRMLTRLDLLAIQPAKVLDLGCRTGYQLEELCKRFPHAQVVGADPAAGDLPTRTRWWQRKSPVNEITPIDPHQLPFADGSFDLVVSNLLLPWCHDPPAVFGEVARILSDNGAFMFTSAGPDTLHEYVELWRSIDSAQHVFGLADMHKTGDEMLQAGFAAPVLDREIIVVDYPSVDALQDELRNIGAGNVAIGRRAGLMAGSVRKVLRSLSPNGRFSVTLELVQGHGWKGNLPQGRKSGADEYSVSLESLRQSLKGTR